MKKKTFPITYIDDAEKRIGLTISKKALEVIMCAPPQEKEAAKKLKRLIRIRRNVFREIEALNKELQRHRERSVIVE